MIKTAIKTITSTLKMPQRCYQNYDTIPKYRLKSKNILPTESLDKSITATNTEQDHNRWSSVAYENSKIWLNSLSVSKHLLEQQSLSSTEKERTITFQVLLSNLITGI